MTSFAPREAMTTAEPPEPLAFSASRIHFYSNKSFNGLTARRRGFFEFFVYFVDCFVVKIRVHSCPFVVPLQWFGYG